jgi:hypothetical protein
MGRCGGIEASPLSFTGRNIGVVNQEIWSVDEMDDLVGDIRIV